jgi:hypothetical protein
MQEAQTNLKQAAVEFVEAAEAAARAVRQSPDADPLDAVETDVFDLGDFEPVLDAGELAALKQRLRRAALPAEALVELVDLARRVAAALAAG